MRQPIGLYLTEFTLEAPATVPFVGAIEAPSFDLSQVVVEGDEPLPMMGEAPGLYPLEADAAATDAATHDIPAEVPAPEMPPPQPDTAAIVEALQAEHAAAMEAARQQWAEQEGAALASGLAAALEALETRIADTLAPLLEPFLVRAAQMETLAELRATLGTLLDGGESAIAISGPADLLAALRQGWAERAGLVFTPSDAADVTITAGDTRIHSQLAGWASALEAALETSLGAPA